MLFNRSLFKFSNFLTQKQVNIIGVQSKAGQPRIGPELAPQILRDSGIIQEIESQGWSVSDHGDLKDFQHNQSEP